MQLQHRFWITAKDNSMIHSKMLLSFKNSAFVAPQLIKKIKIELFQAYRSPV